MRSAPDGRGYLHSTALRLGYGAPGALGAPGACGAMPWLVTADALQATACRDGTMIEPAFCLSAAVVYKQAGHIAILVYKQAGHIAILVYKQKLEKPKALYNAQYNRICV